MTTLGNAQKIIHPEGVAEILSRRRKVRTRIPNKTKMVADRKVWPDARTGAKGQRPTHGRAGTGLASPAGTGAGACLIVAARRDDNSPAIYGWVSIQSTNQVPAGTKESPVLAKDSAVPSRDFGRFRNVNPAINGWAIFKRISFPCRGNSTPRRKVAKTQPDSTADDADGKWILFDLCAFAPLRLCVKIFCRVADRKVWPDARTGAKGQRPTHGRAGAGLASPDGTGAGAGANGKSVGLESL